MRRPGYWALEERLGAPLPMTSGVSRPLGSSLPPSAGPPAGLGARLADVSVDRAASAAQVVLEASRMVRDWLAGRPEDEVRGPALEKELAEFAAGQGWRGPCALWLDSLRRTVAFADALERPARDALEEELGAWLVDEERSFDDELCERVIREKAPLDPVPWNGEPFASGRRLPSRGALARRASGIGIDRGDTILVTAWSESVALALEMAWRAGKDPAVCLPEGLPDLDGRRMARRLSRAGVAVTLVYDSAVLSLVPRVDRVWLSTEAIGAGAFLARAGTRALIEECARRDVPVRVLATSDKLVPGGRLELPGWAEREGWRLWEDAPEGVRLESQFYETVPTALLELVGGFLTEIGPEAVAAMHVRALRVEAAPVLDRRASPGLHVRA